MWRQRTRTLWLKEGDQNSKFFHHVANIRYRHNLIQILHHQGEILTTHFDISNVFTFYFSQIFGAPHHSLLHANWDKLYPNQEWSSWNIESPFNEEEIRVVIFRLCAKKSPGPDGFPIVFFQMFWDLVKLDILSLFTQFYNGNMDLRFLNYALVVLILKKESASMNSNL